MKPGRARQLVDYLCQSYRISVRRACRAYPLDRSTYHYRSRRPDQAALRQRIREIADTRVRYGYRRVHVLLLREGWAINHKRSRRLYRELGLQLRNKNPKRKVAAKLREDRMMASAPNECWTMDFMVDQLFNGRKLRLLTIVRHMQQTVSGDRRCSRLQGTRCRRNLGSSAREHGRPRRIRVDNGPEFVSRDLDLWAWQHGVVLDYSRPGKPTDNALAEGFNSHVRQECLNAFWFLSLDDARCKIEAWRVEYNTIRPHSAIGHVPPSEHAQSLTAACCSQ